MELVWVSPLTHSSCIQHQRRKQAKREGEVTRPSLFLDAPPAESAVPPNCRRPRKLVCTHNCPELIWCDSTGANNSLARHAEQKNGLTTGNWVQCARFLPFPFVVHSSLWVGCPADSGTHRWAVFLQVIPALPSLPLPPNAPPMPSLSYKDVPETLNFRRELVRGLEPEAGLCEWLCPTLLCFLTQPSGGRWVCVRVCRLLSHITSQVFPGTTAGRALRSFFGGAPTRIPFQPLFKNPSRTSQPCELLLSPQEDQRFQKVVGSSNFKVFLSQRPAIVYPRSCGWAWRGREPGRFAPLQRSSWEQRGASWDRGEPSARTMSDPLLDQYCGSVFWVSPAARSGRRRFNFPDPVEETGNLLQCKTCLGGLLPS